MTEKDKESIRAQFNDIAKIQADAYIEAIDLFYGRLPDDVTEEQKQLMYKTVVDNAGAAVSAANEQMIDAIKHEINKINVEEFNNVR